MSAQLELVPPIASETSGGASEETPPPERLYTALPFECAQGYAEQLLGSHVVASNRLTRVVLAELLSSEIPPDMRALAEKIAPETGDRMDNGLVKRVRTAIQRILKEAPGIIEKEGGKNLRVSPCELQARRLGEEGLDSASHMAKCLARDKINSRWYRQKENLLLDLKNRYNLNHEELYILGMLILNIPKGIKQAESRADLLQELLARLPLGYIAESGNTFHSGNRIIEELGGGRPINTYEDTVRIALPENPFGFLDLHKIDAIFAETANEPTQPAEHIILTRSEWAIGYATVLLEEFDMTAPYCKEALAVFLTANPNWQVQNYELYEGVAFLIGEDNPKKKRLCEGVQASVNEISEKFPQLLKKEGYSFHIDPEKCAEIALKPETLGKAALQAIIAALETRRAKWKQKAKDIIIDFDTTLDRESPEDSIEGDAIFEYIIDRILEGGGSGWTPPDHFKNETALLAAGLKGFIKQRKRAFVAGEKLIELVGAYPMPKAFTIPENPFDFECLKGASCTEISADTVITELEKLEAERRSSREKEEITRNLPRGGLKRTNNIETQRILGALDPTVVYYINPHHKSELAAQEIPVQFVPPPDGGSNYNAETADQFDLSPTDVIIKWEDSMGREHFGAIDWKILVTEKTATEMRRRMRTTKETEQEIREGLAEIYADELAKELDKDANNKVKEP